MKKFFCAVVFGLLLCSNNYGQTPFFENYFLLRKNEPVQVNAIFQDKTGYMWYGTNKGLFRFDGIKQKRFTTADSLPDNNVTAIAQDASGKIWTGHKNGKLAYINKNVIKEFRPNEGSAIAEVSDILFDKKGNLWFSTLGDGLYYFTQSRLYRLDEANKMPDLFIYDLEEDQEGNIWAGTDGGVVICALHNRDVTTSVINYDKGLSDNIIKKLALAKDGSMWMGTDGAGIINYDRKSGKCKRLAKDEWKYGSISDFLFYGNKVWISCADRGVVVYDLNTHATELYNAQINPGLNAVHHLLRDAEGNIWAGSSTGVIRTPGDYVEHIETFDPTKNANIISLAIDKQGSIWFSNSEGLFKRTIDKEGIVSTKKQLANTAFKNYTIISLFVDIDGYVWAGSYGEGVLRINPVTGKTLCIKKELADGNILNITGKDHTVWLATLGGATQIKINGEAYDVKNYTRDNGLTSEYVYQVFIDSKNRIWFGTDGKGADMMDGSGFHHYKEGLNSKVVYGFAEDANHDIWANVQDDGIYKFDGKKFNSLNKGNSLHDNNVNCIVSDQFGNLVMMHDLGMEIYDVRKNKISYLGEQVGIRDKKPNLNAVAKDEHGLIYFGTDGGIVIYSDAAKQGINLPVPQIEGLKVLDRNVELNKNLSFKHDQNDITINYLGFWYQNSENLNFQYILENYDRNWITSHNHSVTYSSLPPGNYTFRLRASYSEDFKNLKETSFSFTVLPPFWKTIWFYVLCIFISILLGYAFIKYRERELQKDNKILEAKNDELRKINLELDKFVYSVSHDLRAPLLSMQGIVDITQEESTEEITREHMKMLGGSIERLDRFIGEILDYSRNARLELKKETIDFKNLLDCLTSEIKHMGSESNPVAIKLDIDEQGMFCSDKERLGVILNNLISNSIRYHNPEVKNSFVRIKIDANNDSTHIEVEDNGIGIDEENQKKIFDMFYRVSENSIGAGLGLYIVKETIEKLHGEITVESQPGVGSKFILNIPNLMYQ